MRGVGRRAPKWAALALGLACALGGPAGAAAPADRPTPSGLPVPRWVTLKFAEVNARKGPGDDHRLLWVYRSRGLPVQVVAETSEWRRVCDPEGGLAWVHKRTTDGRRNLMNLRRQPLAMAKKPKPGAKPAAYLGGRALASLLRCEKGWCRVKAGGATGWIREADAWGTAEAPQCRLKS
ncbi:SH3 domain-containing protein [Phenylobacterium sp.]|uniref:SH3 domain-containing protein n=1 Tax=Phenylobacterium sp. TaxID=1871053 RepID=UPI002F91FFF7